MGGGGIKCVLFYIFQVLFMLILQNIIIKSSDLFFHERRFFYLYQIVESKYYDPVFLLLQAFIFFIVLTCLYNS